MTLIPFLQLLAGFLLLVFGADSVVRGASHLASRLGMSGFVIGLTIVAYGTSAPELAVNLGFMFDDPPRSDLLMGTVVGSNISNILLVLGLSSLFRPLSRPTDINPGLTLMVLVSLLAWVFCLDYRIGVLEGGVLLAACLAVTVLMYFSGAEKSAEAPSPFLRRSDIKELLGDPNREPWQILLKDVLIVIAGCVMLYYGSDLLVDSATTIARSLGVSEMVIGLTMVAVGTSIPELVTSLVAVSKGKPGMAIGNVIGSNIFNVLFVIGATSSITRTDIQVSSAMMGFEMPFLLVVTLICALVFLFLGRMSRWIGGLFTGYFLMFVLTRYDLIPSASPEQGMLLWLVPGTTVLLLYGFAKLLPREPLNKPR